jgi:hypothetical protein
LEMNATHQGYHCTDRRKSCGHRVSVRVYTRLANGEKETLIGRSGIL